MHVYKYLYKHFFIYDIYVYKSINIYIHIWRLVKMSCPTLVQKSDLGAGPLLKVFFLLSSFRNKRNYKKSSIFQLKPYFLHNVASAVHFQLVSEEMDHSC